MKGDQDRGEQDQGEQDRGLPPLPRPVRQPGLWPAGLLVVVGVAVTLLGAFTQWLIALLGALLVVGGVVGWLGERLQAPTARTPDERRRRLLAGLSFGLGGLAAAVAAIPIIGVIVTPAQPRKRSVWRGVGRAGDFALGEYTLVSFVGIDPRPWGDGVRESAAWLRRSSERDFDAYSIHCTHLGCPVRWEAGAELFFCPCHGGVFDDHGRAVAGPPRIGLRALRTRVVNGEVQVEAAPVPLPTLTGS